MYKLKMFKGAIWLVLSTTVVFSSYVVAENNFTINGVGTPVTDQQLKKWDISVYYDGENLPEGSGTLERGEEIYNTQCAMCHGDFGEGAKNYPKMLGDPVEDMLAAGAADENNVTSRGINNLWGHAPTLYDFIRRAMPYFAPQSLSDDDAYAVTGYVLYLAEVLDDVETIDAEVLKATKMPAADIFYTDTRPDIKNERCMKDCYDEEPELVVASDGDTTEAE